MRIYIAGLIGAIVLFVWGAVSHMVLPVGEMGIQQATQQDAAIAALQASGDKGHAVYMVPGLNPDEWGDEAKLSAFVSKYANSPSAFVVYDPAPNPNISSMGPALINQFVSNLLVAIIVAWIMATGAFSFGQRIAVGGAIGVAAWLLVSIPYWNWYRFPLDFTIGAWLDYGLGLLLASVPMAWWLGRRR